MISYAVVLAFLFVIGQAGQNIVLPIWLSLLPVEDPYFVLIFTAVTFFIWYGVALLIALAAGYVRSEELVSTTQGSAVASGVCIALNGLLLVYAAPGTRTAPFLQSVLGNISVPMVMFLRMAVIGKKPSRMQFLASCMVMVGMFFCSVPSIFDLDGKTNAPPAPDGIMKFVWPLIFMCGFIPTSLMTVIQERFFQDEAVANKNDDKPKHLQEHVANAPEVVAARLSEDASTGEDDLSTLSFLFVMSGWQTLTMIVGFWTDLIPGYGEAANFHDLLHRQWQNTQATFTEFDPFILAMLFCGMMTLSTVTQAVLIKHSDGATWAALVAGLVTPVGAGFWTLFREKPFGFHPDFVPTTTWSACGVVLISIGLWTYNRLPKEVESKEEALLHGEDKLATQAPEKFLGRTHVDINSAVRANAIAACNFV